MVIELTPADIDAYRRDRFPDFKLSGEWWRRPCPVHGGKRKDSFAINAETGQSRCHSQCAKGWDIPALEQALSGSDFATAVRSIERIIGRDLSTNGHAARRIVAEYDYADENGKLLFQVVRFAPKDFRQRRPDGRGGWVWNVKGVRLVPYRLPQVSAEAEMIWIVEGEKDVLALEKLGFVATCNPQGALKWKDAYARHFRGKTVFVIPDADEPGRKHAETVCRSLRGVAASIRLVTLPTGKDVSVWIALGGDADQLRELAETAEAPAAVPVTVAVDHEHTRQGDLEGFRYTDLANSELMVRWYGPELRFCHAWRKWLCWDGRRWKVDDSGAVYRRAVDTVRSLYDVAADIDDTARRTSIAEWAIKSESRARLDSMVALAANHADVLVQPSELDADPWLLCVENGVVDLRTGKCRPHDRDDLITKIAPVHFEPDAPAPRWTKFLAEVFEPHPDLVSFLQRAVGYSITGITREECLFLLHGTGCNGKGTLIKLVDTVLGDYAGTADFSSFIQRRDDSGPRDDIAHMAGKRLVAAQESREGAALAESLLKWLTGGDKVRARRLYENSWEFTPTHKIWLATNHKPRVRGTDPAIWSRIKLVPFDVSFEGHEDRNLKDALGDEREGILAWCVAGCLAYLRDGLAFPESVTAATAEYRHESDQAARFAEECGVVGEYSRARFRDLYGALKKWCEENDETPISSTAFGRRLVERGFKKIKERTGVVYTGIGLRDDLV